MKQKKKPDWLQVSPATSLSNKKLDSIDKISHESIDSAVADFLASGGQVKKYSQTHGLIESDYFEDPLQEKKDFDSVTSHYLGKNYLK